MRFQYVELAPSEAQQYFSRLKGPVLSGVGTAAIDADSGAVLLELGGNGREDAALGYPPIYYNLFFKEEVIAGEARKKSVKEADGFVTLITLHLKMPRSVADQLDQIQRLYTAGLGTLFSSGGAFPVVVRVTIAVVVEST